MHRIADLGHQAVIEMERGRRKRLRDADRMAGRILRGMLQSSEFAVGVLLMGCLLLAVGLGLGMTAFLVAEVREAPERILAIGCCLTGVVVVLALAVVAVWFVRLLSAALSDAERRGRRREEAL